MKNNIQLLEQAARTNEQTATKLQQLIKRSSLLITIAATALLSSCDPPTQKIIFKDGTSCECLDGVIYKDGFVICVQDYRIPYNRKSFSSYIVKGVE